MNDINKTMFVVTGRKECKMDRNLIKILILFILLSGCNSTSSKEDKSLADESSNIGASINHNLVSSDAEGVNEIEEPNSNTIKDIPHQLLTLPFGEITDPNTLDLLWQTYFHQAIPTVLHNRNFSHPSEILLDNVVSFAASKYEEENGIEHLELMEDSNIRIISFSEIEPYVKKYFNMDKIDVERLSKHLKTGDSKYLFNSLDLDDNGTRSYGGFSLENVNYHQDYSITADLVTYYPLHNEEVKMTHSLTLKLSELSNSYYFAKGTYKTNHQMQIEGDYVDVDSLKEYALPKTLLKVIGETDDKIIIYVDFNSRDKTNQIVTINSNTYYRIKELELEAHNESINLVKYHDNKIVVEKDDMISIYNDDLDCIQQISLPEIIRQKSPPELLTDLKERERSNGLIHNYYDISSDYSRIVYVDQEGLKLYTIDTGIEELITESPNTKGILSPRFVGKDDNIMATIPGTQCNNGFMFYNTVDKKLDTHHIHSYYMYLDNLSIGDTIVMSVMLYDKDIDTDLRGYIVFDVNTGHYYILDNKYFGENGFTNLASNGRYEAAFIQSNLQRDDDYYQVIHQYNFENRSLNKMPMNIPDEADLDIIGILEDGRVLIKYHDDYNHEDYGVFVPK